MEETMHRYRLTVRNADGQEWSYQVFASCAEEANTEVADTVVAVIQVEEWPEPGAQ